MQGGLFTQETLIQLSDRAVLSYYPDVFAVEAEQWFRELEQSLPWQQDNIRLAGKTLVIPRLQCWFGEQAYTYSGIRMPAQPMPAQLLQIQQAVEQACGYTFNSVLANLYRNGQDSVSWHADDEPELGQDPVIASLSLGATRHFRMKPKDPACQNEPKKIALSSGSLLVMGPGVQAQWLHCLPKEPKVREPRINLTFRLLKNG